MEIINYYTSDLHICCQAALKGNSVDFDERPFSTIKEMQDFIENKWNNKVTNADHVYILGDIDRRGYNPDVVSWLARLKGNKHLIVGNHDDMRDARLQHQFCEIAPYKELQDYVDKMPVKLVLSHYPIMMWNGQHSGWIHLYGHIHKSYDDKFFQDKIVELNAYYQHRDGERYKPFYAYNVGCMLWDFEPVTLKEILNNNETKA